MSRETFHWSRLAFSYRLRRSGDSTGYACSNSVSWRALTGWLSTGMAFCLSLTVQILN